MKKISLAVVIFFFLTSENIIRASGNNNIASYFKNPHFFDSDPTVLGQVNINHYAFDAIKDLEIVEKIIQILRAHPQLNTCDRMLLLWLSRMLKNTENVNQVIDSWRSIAKDHGRNQADFTSKQIETICLPDQDIKGLYQQVQEYIVRAEPALTQELIIRVLKRHQWNDKHQVDLLPLRSLAIMKDRKIHVTLLKDCVKLVQKMDRENPEIPIYEQIKNYKVFHINDFYASKGALIAHDTFDHLWFAAKLEEKKLFERYKKLWKSLGSPQLHDIFSRESELFASIAFDFRAFHRSDADYSPWLSVRDIQAILEESVKNDPLQSNQQQALHLLVTSQNDSLFKKGLAYIVSGMAIELLELSRKAGYIKILDEQCGPSEYFNFFDPEFIAFTVEAVYFLFQDREQYVQCFTNISLLVEKYLTDIASNDTTYSLIISVEDMEKLHDVDLSIISPERVAWIKGHPGFESVRHFVN
jgi:hypothetical protein